MEQLLLSKFDYYIEESDPDIVILRRQDGAFVAAFSGRGATREGIGSSRRRRPKEERLTWCALIHPSAWKKNSANFALTEFSEVHPVNLATRHISWTS
jgi:hypothetical protein